MVELVDICWINIPLANFVFTINFCWYCYELKNGFFYLCQRSYYYSIKTKYVILKEESTKDHFHQPDTSKRYSNWSYLSLVIKSGCLSSMNRKEIELQERWFEILSTEQQYLSSLTILNCFFKKKCADILEPYDLDLLFTRYIDDLIDISK